MPEAIIKYAVNSTLGREDFKPLNELIIGYFNDSIIVSPSAGTIVSGNLCERGTTTVFEQIMNLGGQLRVSGTANLPATTSAHAKMAILLNDVEDVLFDYYGNGSSSTSRQEDKIITVSENDNLKIQITLSNTSSTNVEYALYGGVSFGKNIFK